jgi:PAS domain-containing protein
MGRGRDGQGEVGPDLSSARVLKTPGTPCIWNWKDYLQPDDYESTLSIWKHSLETGEPYEVEYRFRRASDGAYRWFIGRAMPLRQEDGTMVRWFGACTDVHEERVAHANLRRSEERYRNVTRATNDVVWEWEIASGALWWNENLEGVFGLTAEELPTLDEWEEHLHPEDRERAILSTKT